MLRTLAILILAAGCSRPSYVTYEPGTKEFFVEVPKGWALNERGPFSRKPTAEVEWIGKIVDSHEGYPVGAVMTIRRISRKKEDFSSKQQFERFQRETLKEFEDLIAGKKKEPGVSVAPAEAAGLKGWLVRREFDDATGGFPPFHGERRSNPSRLEILVLRSADYDYALEYRATKELFERYRPHFERLKSSFRLKK